MKQFLLSLLLVLILPATTIAAERTAQNGPYTIKSTCNLTECTISASYSGVSKSVGTIEFWKTSKPAETPGNSVFSDKITEKDFVFDTKKSDSFVVGNLTANTNYYITYIFTGISKEASITLKTDNYTSGSFDIEPQPLSYGVSQNGSMVVTGKLITKKVPQGYKQFEKVAAKLEYSSLEDFSGSILAADAYHNEYYGQQSNTIQKIGVGGDGAYFYKVINLEPGSAYYAREIITLPDGNTKTILRESFTEKGHIPANSPEAVSAANQKTYRLLAPLPGLSVLLDPQECSNGKAIGTISPDAICDINDLISYTIRFLVGLSAAFLVVRLMVEGYNYMTTDIPAMKVSAKSNFKEMLLGLLLALSSYVILNTINPKLVTNTSVIQSVAVGGLEDDQDIAPEITQGTYSIPKGAVAACTVGIEQVSTSGGIFYACKTISQKFKEMINKAHAAGYKISGGGFRTRERQIALRAQNCGGSGNALNTKAICKPPTAYPGRSRHESGLAFDLTCDGQTIKSRDNKCFVWLQANAKNYGLTNFSKEPWHWSVDGR